MREISRFIKTPLTLLALTAIVVFGGVWGYQNATAQIPPRPPEPCVMTNVGTALTPQHVTVRVLNAGLRGGLAKRVSTSLRSYRFNVIKVNNSDQRLTQTTIVGNAANDPEVILVAGFFKNAKTQGDGRIDHVVDVLLGDNFGGYQVPPTSSVAVSGPVCLPALPTPSASAPPASIPAVSPSPSPSR